MVTTNTERVRAGLERLIVAGTLAPGTTLDEAELSQLYEVSRTPVREALLQLSAEGYVRIVPRAGIYVVQMSAGELMDMCETLAFAEGLCAQLACQRMTTGQQKRIGQLQEAGRRALEAQDADAYAHYNLAFHECLYAGSGNRYLRAQILHIRKRINPYRLLQEQATPDWSSDAWDQHQSLYEALQAGDAAAAMRIACDYIRSRASVLSELVETTPEHLFFGPGVGGVSEHGRVDMSHLFKPMHTSPSTN